MKTSEDFKQLLERYKWGKVNEEEKEYVEKELEKAEALQEYLFDSEELPSLNNAPDFEGSSTVAVRNIVRRKWLKHGFITGFILLIILIGGWSLGRPLLNKLYFDPTAGRTAETYSDYELYQKIDNAVLITGDTLEDIQIEQTGIGSYLLRYNYYDVLKNEAKVQAVVLKRGQVERQATSGIVEAPLYSYRTYSTREMFGAQHNQELEELKEKVSKLPETAIMKINLHFDNYNQTSLADIKSLVLDHKLKHLLTVGVASSEYDILGMSTFGIRFNNSYRGYGDGRSWMNMAQIREINKEYPHLIQNGAVMINSDPEMLEQYYLSMLNYLLDNEELGEKIERVFNPTVYAAQSMESEDISAIGELKTHNQYLAEAKEYVKENGVIITQATLLVSPEEFTALLADERVPMVGVIGAEWMDSRTWQ